MSSKYIGKEEEISAIYIDDPVRRILYVNPIRTIWRMSYLVQCFGEPLYSNIERRHGVSRTELVAMHCIALSGELRAQQVVDILLRPKNTVSGAVHSLARKRLIKRKADLGDGRSAILELTAKGKALYDLVLPELERKHEHLVAKLSEAEQRTLDRLLLKMIDC